MGELVQSADDRWLSISLPELITMPILEILDEKMIEPVILN